MSKAKRSSTSSATSGGRRQFTKEFKEQAVQMLLDGHSASSIVERLGLSGTNLLHRWRRELVGQSGRTAEGLDDGVRQLEVELKRVQQERDILKKALAIFGRSE